MLRYLLARTGVGVPSITAPAGDQAVTGNVGSPATSAGLKDQWARGLSGATALVTALAGRHFWVLALMLLVALAMSFIAVCWLAAQPNSGSVRVGFIEWRARSQVETEPDASERPTLSRRRSWPWSRRRGPGRRWAGRRRCSRRAGTG